MIQINLEGEWNHQYVKIFNRSAKGSDLYIISINNYTEIICVQNEELVFRLIVHSENQSDTIEFYK